jgi:rSAM/selenodomain-associated transferase 1
MAILGVNNDYNTGKDSEVFHFPMSKNALIIFTRNPELGKCKTRLAATVGDDAALKIYKFLLNHTVAITTPLKAVKFVYNSVALPEGYIWDTAVYRKKVQDGNDLGLRMEHAFKEVFALGYERAIVIGSDMYDMTTDDLSNGFDQLNDNDFVLGPAEDGGYYLLGMKKLNAEIFQNKAWGTDTVLRDTLADLKEEQVALLEEKNDVDYYDDIKNVYAFQEFFPAELRKTND